jgi:hypothetical protein
MALELSPVALLVFVVIIYVVAAAGLKAVENVAYWNTTPREFPRQR